MKPFIELCKDRATKQSHEEIERQAGRLLLAWSMKSASHMVSLADVAWIGAAIILGDAQAKQMRSESVNEHGARVVTATLTDGVPLSDGAG